VKRRDFVTRAALLAGGATLGARPRPGPSPSPTPAPDPQAEAMFGAAREWWHARKDAPYLTYGALIRYKHGAHVFDNWWNATFRSSDRAIRLERIAIPEDEAKRLKGFPITIFGFKIGDTNPDAEPIRVEPPQIDPTSDFGVFTRYRSNVDVNSESTPNPLEDQTPEPKGTPLREIGSVQAYTRDYDVRLVGEETLRYGDAYHLRLTPLRDPKILRLRDLWVSKANSATMQIAIDGIFNGKPYDATRWTVSYVPIGGRWYVQQIVGADLRFGFDTKIDAMEFDFVDYHFPADVPKFTFDRLL
jgi:hypothetical protein